MTHDEHRKRHVFLHRMFDELIADYFTFNRGKLPINTTIGELMTWSYKQTNEPEELQHGFAATDPFEDLPLGPGKL
jgi:hypothetical protein